MSRIYDWIYFNRRRVLAGCALAIALLLVLMLLAWSNRSTREALKEYERPPAPIHRRPLPWSRAIFY